MERDIEVLFEKLIHWDRVALGQAMTLVESERLEDRRKASLLLEKCEKRLEQHDPSIRMAVSGAPGAGKSTLIEVLGQKALSNGYKVGVITIDPTSSLSHGSILGDKARMSGLSVASDAFIRSSAAGSVLGGLGRRSLEMMTLLATVGYDLILMETVGVGQSEHIAWKITDGFILVLSPGSGDELQGIKRGITELADIVIVTKADGNLKEIATSAKNHYRNAMHFFSSQRNVWTPKVLTCSALTGEGIDDTWDVIRSYMDECRKNPSLSVERNDQKVFWLTWSLGQTAHQLLINHPLIKEKLEAAQSGIRLNNQSPFHAEFEIENLMKTIVESAGLKNEV